MDGTLWLTTTAPVVSIVGLLPTQEAGLCTWLARLSVAVAADSLLSRGAPCTRDFHQSDRRVAEEFPVAD